MSNPSKRGLGWPWNNPSSYFSLYKSGISSGTLSWLFNWEMWAPADLPQGIEYVPQVRLGSQAEQIDAFLSTLKRERGGAKALLGFNEPERGDQANLRVEEAATLWRKWVLPAKGKFGVRLGSPGVSSAPEGKRWLEDFVGSFGNGEDSGLDFMVVHWYGRDADEMMRYLEEMHKTFKMPLWLNEFAYSNLRTDPPVPRVEDVQEFLRKALPRLDACEYLERYSYFGAPLDVGEWVGRASNFTEEGEAGGGIGKRLTSVGQQYLGL